jgi:glutamine synthetase
MISDKAKSVFSAQGVFNERELHSRYEVLLEKYINSIGIEADLFEEMSRTYVLPAALEAINKLGETHRNLNDMGFEDEAKSIASQALPIAESTNELTKNLSELMEAKAAADAMSDTVAMARAYCDQVKPWFDAARANIDRLEGLVDQKIWSLPKYRELLFLR